MPFPRGEDDKPKEGEEHDPYNFDALDNESMSAPAFRDNRDLTDETEVPQFWGVVKVGDWGGVRGCVGYE